MAYRLTIIGREKPRQAPHLGSQYGIIRYRIQRLMMRKTSVACNKGRAYFGIYGYHFDPNEVTSILGLTPTTVNDAGMHGSLDKPVLSSWEFSTETITSETQEMDIYKLIDDEILKKIEPAKDKIIEVCKNLNLSPRINVELTLSIDKDETAPDVGFGARIIKFCAEIGAFINIDYKLSERI